MAVGLSSDNGSPADYQTLIETLSDGTWTITSSPDPGTNGNSLSGVACTGASSCVAVGYSHYGAQNVLIETDSGGTWTVADTGGAGGSLSAVSCPSPSFCVAAGSVSAVLSGGNWSVGPFVTPGQSSVLSGISCSATTCIAVGEDYSNPDAEQWSTLIESYSGGSWQTMPSPNVGSDSYLYGVSCTDPTDCVAVGYSLNTPLYPQVSSTLVEVLSNGTWAVTSSPNPAGTSGTSLNRLLGVVCSTTNTCQAVGWTEGNGSMLEQTLAMTSMPAQGGYDLVGSDGGVFVFPTGQAGGYFGSLPGLGVKVNNVVGIVPTNNYNGYDLVGSDGGVFVFPTGQSSGYFGSLPGLGVRVNNIVGIVSTNNFNGYDLVGSDGGVFVFPTGQSNGYYGSLPGLGVRVNDIVGIVATPGGGGYFLVGKDGGVFTFGNAPYLGSLPGNGIHVSDIRGIASTPDGHGYYVVGANGAVYPFGDAKQYGDLPDLGVNVSNIASIVPTPDGGGYWLIGADGGVFTFGDATFQGSLPGVNVHVGNVVGAVPTS